MQMKNLILIILALQIIYLRVIFAFPDTIRHGYVNCTTCHVSPSGGGLLNSYGRSLSRELISTWGFKDEEHLFQGLVKIPDDIAEKIFVGGDVRHLNRVAKSATKNTDEKFLMQSQLRMGFSLEKLKLIASIGKIENPRTSQEVKMVSPEYYALWAPKEELHFRAGRFEPVYGLRMPDHDLWIKSETGFVPWAERDSVEFIYEGEKQFVSVAGFQSTSAMSVDQQLTGYTGSFYQIFNETSRLGFSGMNSEGQGVRLRTASLHATISFSEKSYLLSEFTRVANLDTTKDIGFARYGYEFHKGITPFIQFQAKATRGANPSDQNKYGIGLSWFPRPHFEVMSRFEQQKNAGNSSDEIVLLLHYYL